MEIHRFEKVWLGVSVVLILALISSVVYGAVGPGIQMVEDDGGTVDQTAIQERNYDQTDNFRDPGVYQTGENSYAVYVVSLQFQFQPGSAEPIRVPEGSTVTFYVTSADVVHGFNLVGTNVNIMAIPGQVAQITVEFDETKQYGIVCHEYCGSGHHTMAGTIEVVPQSEFDEDEDTVNGGA